MGRGLRGDRPASVADPRRARKELGRRLHRQPERAQPLGARLWAGVAAGAGHAEHLLRIHGRPDAQEGVRRPHVRHDAVRAGAGRGPHGPPSDPGREPAGLEREPAHGTGHARPPAPDSRARRQGRGGRPAPHTHHRGRRRAPLHPARHGRAATCRDGLHARGGGPRPTRPGRRSPQRPGSGGRPRVRLRPRTGGGGLRHRSRGDSAIGA